MNKSFSAIGTASALVCTLVSSAHATTWQCSGKLPINDADLIVRGKVIAVTNDDLPHGILQIQKEQGKVGIIEVSDVLYGPHELKKVCLLLESRRYGNEYCVGDEGTWCLKRLGDYARQAMEGWRPPTPLPLDLSNTVFEAEHPDTFEPENDNWYEKERKLPDGLSVKRLVLRRTPEDKAAMRIAILSEIEQRLRLDLNYLSRRQDEARANQTAVKKKLAERKDK